MAEEADCRDMEKRAESTWRFRTRSACATVGRLSLLIAAAAAIAVLAGSAGASPTPGGDGARSIEAPASKPRPFGPARGGKAARPPLRVARVPGVKGRPKSRPRPVVPARGGKAARPPLRAGRVASVKRPPKSKPPAVQPAVTEKMQRLSRRLAAPRPESRPPANSARGAPRDPGGNRTRGDSYRFFDYHPVNYSPPWMEGTRSVGSTLNLHVGGWWNAETYWIYLWQWTPAYGWQQVGWYDLGYATSMPFYLGWEWAYSYIAFEVWAWNSNPWHGWSDPAWSAAEYVYPYWGRPWNASPPWLEGTPAVGNSVQLHTGSWYEAEQYAIELHRWTSAAGWSYIGTYNLGGATSMSLYLGTDWADSYIGYYAWAWNPPHGWSDPAWTGPYWVDSRRPANVSGPYVAGTREVGNTVSLNVGSWRDTEQYAIELHRWTAAAGWTYIGTYYIGSATSMSLYLGTDWADAYIGFYAWAWNSIWGWSANAWSGAHWVDPARPVNVSGPYVTGMREVGSTVSLNVGQWQRTEQYAIELHRWTAAAGWTYLTTYYLGSATSMSLYLGWEWADSYIGFYAWGWNSIWGWSTYAWSGEHYVDPLSVAVSLGPLQVTTYDPAVTSSATDWGANVTTTIADSSARESYRWRFHLAANQRLQALAGGGVAVVSDPLDEDVDDGEDDYSDADPVDPEDIDEGIETDESAPEDGVDEEPEEEEDEYDDTPIDDEADGDAPGERSLALFDEAQDEVEDGIVEAVAAPQAFDAAGQPVPASFTVGGSVATLTVSHRSASYTYPFSATVELVEALDASAYTEDDLALDASATRMQTLETTAEAAVTCQAGRRAKIITYNPTGRTQLMDAFKRYPTPCADYFIVIPPLAGPTKPRAEPWSEEWVRWKRQWSIKKRTPRPNAARDVCEMNNHPAVRDAKARFYPVAEFHWGGWGWWVWHEEASRRYGSIPARWRRAGINYRQRMQGANQGYGRDCPATPEHDPIPEYWAINEFPSTLFVANRDEHLDRTFEPAEVRRNTKQAMAGLYAGPGGFGPRDDNNPRRSRPCERPIYVSQGTKVYVDCPGIPFVINAGQTKKYFNRYKPGVRALILDASYWNAVRTYVKFWSQEAYVNCWKVCLTREYGGTQLYNPATRARFTNAYSLHPIKLAEAGARAGSARARRALGILNRRYTPLLTAVWNSSVYGHTEGEGFGAEHEERMLGHVSLQVYSTRRHAALGDGSSAHGKYPHLRIGFAWKDQPEFLEGGARNPYHAPNQRMADRLAQAIRAAYRTDVGNVGTPAAACAGGPDSAAGDWCRVSVPRTACGPHGNDDHRTVFIRAWEKTFTSWTKLFNRTVYC
jgi:hypothetical protein